MKHLSSLVLVAILVATCTDALWAQAQKEHYGAEAARIVPGANFVLDGLNTPYPAYVMFDSKANIELPMFFDWMQRTFSLDQQTGFKLLSQETDETRTTHYRYVQTFKAIPMGLTTLLVHVKNQKVIGFNGTVFEVPKESVVQPIGEPEALAAALSYVGADQYMWEDPVWTAMLREKTGDETATYFPEGELIWSPVFTGAVGETVTFRLAYRFLIRASSPHSEQLVLMDAENGTFIKTFPMESNCEPTNIATIWNGNRTISTDLFQTMPDNFRLRDDCTAGVIRIRDWNSATTTSNPLEITSSNNTWTTMDQQFGGTVLWHTKQCYNYFNDIHSRNSYDNAGGDIDGFVNAIFGCGAGCVTSDNASMSFTGGTMKVGLGSSGTLLNSWGTLDIIGHEYAHAVTGSTSALVYEREPGALNESFSDIFGEVIENYTTGSNDWLMGQDRSPGGAIRSLSNPKGFGQPDTYQGTNWVSTTSMTCNSTNDQCGVHTNSGVQNFWFYLLTVGGTGTDDNGNSFDVDAIGLNKARLISFLNLTTQLGVNSQHADARAGSIAVATSAYGACSNEVIQVKNAWYAVGVGTPGMPAYDNTYNDPGVCSGTPFSIDLQSKRTANLVTPTYTWTVSYPAGISGGNGNCGGGCANTVNETLVNNTSTFKTVTYTVTPRYDGCNGPTFTIFKPVFARPMGDNSSQSVSCSRDAFTVDLQTKITNGVSANFSWTVNYNGLTNGLGAGSGNFINESLSNTTGAVASAVYTVTPVGAIGSCPGASFTVTVTVPPVLTSTAAGVSDYNGYNISCHGGSDGMAEAFPLGGTPPYGYLWNDPGSQTTKVAVGLMATTYNVTVTDDNGCTNTASTTLTEPPPLFIEAGDNQTVYFGYPPAACATLSWSGASGGVPPYNISWSTGETTQSIEVCPMVTTTYTVTLEDANGCIYTDEVTVCAIDVRCGNNLDKVEICHIPPNNIARQNTLCVGLSSVAMHLAHGDILAACGTDHNCPPAVMPINAPLVERGLSLGTEMVVYPNPFNEKTTVTFSTQTEGTVTITLLDVTGRTIKTLFNAEIGTGVWYAAELEGGMLSSGLYYCQLMHSDGTLVTQKLVVQK